jgi:aspartate kinase
MNVLVRKYGGTSVADSARVAAVARSIVAASTAGPTVVVVSAQGDATDRLLATATESGTRETDQLLVTAECASAALLAMAVRAGGAPAVSLTGGQAGITVAGPAGEGRIVDIDTRRVLRELADGNVVVVAGFHGVDADGDVVTLGRGGSDTTAVALAARLGAARCEIHTDVDGVFSADPRLVPDAVPLPVVDTDVMVELAFAGARVLHSRAVELAAAHGVELHVRSSFHDRPGTLVTRGDTAVVMEEHGVLAVTSDLDVARVLIKAIRPGCDPTVAVLRLFADHNAPVDLVARSGPHEEEVRLGFTMRASDLPRVGPGLCRLVEEVGATLAVDENVGKVSLVGTGLLNDPRHTATMLTALDRAGIATTWVSTTQSRTSVTVRGDRAVEAVAVLHAEVALAERFTPA